MPLLPADFDDSISDNRDDYGWGIIDDASVAVRFRTLVSYDHNHAICRA